MILRQLAERPRIVWSLQCDPLASRSGVTAVWDTYASGARKDLVDQLRGPLQQVGVLQRLAGVGGTRGPWYQD